MDKRFWLELLGIVARYYTSVKMLSKQLAKIVVKYIFLFSGAKGYITTYFLAKALEIGIIEIKDLGQKFKDYKTLKKFKEELPKGNTDERKKLENDILSGG